MLEMSKIIYSKHCRQAPTYTTLKFTNCRRHICETKMSTQKQIGKETLTWDIKAQRAAYHVLHLFQ